MKTILYYTSNRERPELEEKIQANILKQSNLPIISVSQKPIDFGHNICVGDRGLSYINEWRQILIGAKEATTEYLVFAESDFLYPKEYFDFEPSGENIYRYDNVWIVFDKLKHAFRKKFSEGAQIVKRDYFIKEIEEGLEGLPEWFNGRDIPWVSKSQKKRFHIKQFSFFSGTVPAVSFKTGLGVRANTTVIKEERTLELPYWGEVIDLKRRNLNDIGNISK